MEVLTWEYNDDTWTELKRLRDIYLRRRGVNHQPFFVAFKRGRPTRVTFTSTGVDAGKEAHLWRSRWWQLNYACWVSGGCKALILWFIHRWGIGGRKLALPLPPEVEEHVIDMAEHLLVPKSVGQRPLEIIRGDDTDLDVFDPSTSSDTIAMQVEWTPIRKGGSVARTHFFRPVYADRVELRGIGLRETWVFDAALGFYPEFLVKFGRKEPLRSIHALQLVSEIFGDAGERNVSWELNLVLDNAQRVNLVDHGDWANMLADAEKLAQFLNVPLWKGF